MGSEQSRIWTNFGIGAAGILLAPVTGGVSAVAGFGLIGTRVGSEMYVNSQLTHNAEINNEISYSSQLMEKKVTRLEIRYCHISSDINDALITLVGRATFMSAMAAHHHFVILTLESGEYIYVDKHGYRNIIERNDKRGKNGPGNEWLESALLKECTSNNITLRNVVDYINNYTSGEYHLLDKNCQHYAQQIYDWGR